MKIILIPCFLSTSTDLADNTARFKEITFDRFIPKFPINLDAKYPVGFDETLITSENEEFATVLMDVQEKATEYWKKFAKKYLKQPEAFDENLQKRFHVTIIVNHWGLFAFLNDNFIDSNVMRFYVLVE